MVESTDTGFKHSERLYTDHKVQRQRIGKITYPATPIAQRHDYCFGISVIKKMEQFQSASRGSQSPKSTSGREGNFIAPTSLPFDNLYVTARDFK
jgi:hypothetical protein